MTKITYDKNHISIKGHAGYSNGEDIVCSAISVLVYTIVEHALKNQIPIKYELAEGCVDIEIDAPFVDAIKTGFSLIADSYPDNLTITNR